MRRPIAVLMFLLLASNAFAGTLISGSAVEVKSNYDGFSGLSLVGTWSTTPTVTDRLTVSNASLPAPYGLRDTIDIDVLKPQFEQVFRVNNQQPLYRLSFAEKTYTYLNIPGLGKSASQLCEDAFDADLKKSYSGQALLSGTSGSALVSNVYCSVQFVLVSSQAGWVGSPIDKGLYYDQNISLDGIGTLHLVRNEKQDQLTDRINGVGRATLVNIGQWTNAKFTSKNIYAYHGKNALGTDAWKPFEDTQGITAYQDALSSLQSLDGITLTQNTYLQIRAQNQQYVTKANNEVTRIVGVAANLPGSWDIGGTVRYAGNDIIVPYDRTAFVAQIQLVLAGSKFGLYIPTGTPKILSADSKVTFEETGSGGLKYSVKNTGTGTGTFVLKGVCSNSQVITDEIEMSLKAGETKSGTIRNTAKSQTFAKTESTSCTLSFTETNTKAVDSVKYTAEVIVKQSCVDGEETDPTFESAGQKYVVYVLDAQCSAKSSKECLLTYGTFQKQNGLWTCVKHDGTAPPPANDDEGGKSFSSILFFASLIVGVVLGGFVSWGTSKLPFLPSKNKWLVLLAVFVVVMVVGTLLTASVIKGGLMSAKDYFSLMFV